MRTFTITRTAFAWSELSEAAKDHAREAHSRFLWDSGDAQESMELIFDGIMDERGWADAELRTYSLYSQGGYPTWRGTLPSFTHEGRVYPLTVTTRHSGGGSEHMVCDVEDPETDEDEVYGTPAWNGFVARLTSAREAAESMVSDLSSALLYAFRAEDDYQTSEEVMAETAEANGYEYDEDGDLI